VRNSNFDENRRLLMQLEASTRAGLVSGGWIRHTPRCLRWGWRGLGLVEADLVFLLCVCFFSVVFFAPMTGRVPAARARHRTLHGGSAVPTDTATTAARDHAQQQPPSTLSHVFFPSPKQFRT
jgi:hypothetical protein